MHKGHCGEAQRLYGGTQWQRHHARFDIRAGSQRKGDSTRSPRYISFAKLPGYGFNDTLLGCLSLHFVLPSPRFGD